MMDKRFEYESIKLNKEIHFIGEILHDACNKIFIIESSINEYELTNILYNLSIGIERLQKVIILMSQEEKNPSKIKIHKLNQLGGIISNKYNVALNNKDNSFIKFLTRFYERNRYPNFDYGIRQLERNLVVGQLNDLLEKSNVSLLTDSFGLTFNISECTLKYLKNRVSSILKFYVNLLKKITRNKNIYTTEVETDSKVSFLIYSHSNVFRYFEREKIAVSELYYYFLAKEDDDFKKLDFDKAEIGNYLYAIKDNKMLYDLIDFVEEEYLEFEENKEYLHERKELMLNFEEVHSYFM